MGRMDTAVVATTTTTAVNVCKYCCDSFCELAYENEETEEEKASKTTTKF